MERTVEKKIKNLKINNSCNLLPLFHRNYTRHCFSQLSQYMYLPQIKAEIFFLHSYYSVHLFNIKILLILSTVYIYIYWYTRTDFPPLFSNLITTYPFSKQCGTGFQPKSILGSLMVCEEKLFRLRNTLFKNTPYHVI